MKVWPGYYEYWINVRRFVRVALSEVYTVLLYVTCGPEFHCTHFSVLSIQRTPSWFSTRDPNEKRRDSCSSFVSPERGEKLTSLPFSLPSWTFPLKILKREGPSLWFSHTLMGRIIFSPPSLSRFLPLLCLSFISAVSRLYLFSLFLSLFFSSKMPASVHTILRYTLLALSWKDRKISWLLHVWDVRAWLSRQTCGPRGTCNALALWWGLFPVCRSLVCPRGRGFDWYILR